MKSFSILLALAALAAQVSALTVNTPASIVECEPIQFTWTSDGTAPYFLTLIPGGQPSAAPLKQFPATTGTSYSWIADLPSGTQITVALRDSTGNQVFSDAVTIQPGTSTTCVNTTVIEGTASSGATAPTSGTPGSTTSAPASGPSSPAPGNSSPAASASGKANPSSGSAKPSGSSSASSPSKSNSATARGASAGALGLAGLMGLVGAALL